MRLIDADSLIERLEEIKKHIDVTLYAMFLNNAIAVIETQPTAYNVDGVVEQLEQLKDVPKDDSVEEFITTRVWNKAISMAINAVKGGRVDEMH